MTTELTTEQLAAELERRRQQEAQEQQHHAAVLRESQQDWSRALLNVRKAKEQELEDEGAASMKAAEQAVRDGDLPAAFAGYTGWHASRWARYHLRSAAQSAVNRVPEYTGPSIGDLRIVDVSFPDWLNQQCSKLAESNGADKYEEILGAEIPGTYDEAMAWLESRRGN